MIGPDRRTPCERFAADLAGYVDHSLTRSRTEAVQSHLRGCAACQDEVVSQKSLCAALGSAPRPASAPPSLESRLVSIAGEASAAPLYMAKSRDGELPSVRARRRRLAGVTMAGGSVAVLFVLTLALMLAPDLKVLADPTRSARQDFATAVAAAGMNEAVAAVLIARDRGAELERAQAVAPRAVEGQSRRVPLGQALEWLAGVIRPQNEIGGMQRVAIADGSGFVMANVYVTEAPHVGTKMSVQTASGETVSTSFVSSQDVWDAAIFDADYEYYAYTNPAVVAGHSVVVLEARSAGSVMARWWLDTDSRLLVWSERFGSGGDLTLAAGYVSFTPVAASTATDATRVASMPRGQAPTGDWCRGWARCPTTLANLPLVAFSSSGVVRPSMHLVYSDGVVTLTVVREWGILDEPDSRIAEHGVPRVLSRQSGTSVVTLATNGSEALLEVAEKSLPWEPPVTPDLGWQLRTGLARLVGASDG